MVLRRRPVRIVEGRQEGGYTEDYEIVCCDCGDDPDLDYCEVSPALQRIRGPYPVAAGITAYVLHARRHPRPQEIQRPARRVPDVDGWSPVIGSHGSDFGRLGPGSMSSQAAHDETTRHGLTLVERG